MKLTQQQRVLKTLKENNGRWVNGRYFNNTMMISQFHTRIKELEEAGHQIEHSDFKDKYGFKYYRIRNNDNILDEIEREIKQINF